MLRSRATVTRLARRLRRTGSRSRSLVTLARAQLRRAAHIRRSLSTTGNDGSNNNDNNNNDDADAEATLQAPRVQAPAVDVPGELSFLFGESKEHPVAPEADVSVPDIQGEWERAILHGRVSIPQLLDQMTSPIPDDIWKAATRTGDISQSEWRQMERAVAEDALDQYLFIYHQSVWIRAQEDPRAAPAYFNQEPRQMVGFLGYFARARKEFIPQEHHEQMDRLRAVFENDLLQVGAAKVRGGAGILANSGRSASPSSQFAQQIDEADATMMWLQQTHPDVHAEIVKTGDASALRRLLDGDANGAVRADLQQFASMTLGWQHRMHQHRHNPKRPDWLEEAQARPGHLGLDDEDQVTEAQGSQTRYVNPELEAAQASRGGDEDTDDEAIPVGWRQKHKRAVAEAEERLGFKHPENPVGVEQRRALLDAWVQYRLEVQDRFQVESLGFMEDFNDFTQGDMNQRNEPMEYDQLRRKYADMMKFEARHAEYDAFDRYIRRHLKERRATMAQVLKTTELSELAGYEDDFAFEQDEFLPSVADQGEQKDAAAAVRVSEGWERGRMLPEDTSLAFTSGFDQNPVTGRWQPSARLGASRQNLTQLLQEICATQANLDALRTLSELQAEASVVAAADKLAVQPDSEHPLDQLHERLQVEGSTKGEADHRVEQFLRTGELDPRADLEDDEKHTAPKELSLAETRRAVEARIAELPADQQEREALTDTLLSEMDSLPESRRRQLWEQLKHRTTSKMGVSLRQASDMVRNTDIADTLAQIKDPELRQAVAGKSGVEVRAHTAHTRQLLVRLMLEYEEAQRELVTAGQAPHEASEQEMNQLLEEYGLPRSVEDVRQLVRNAQLSRIQRVETQLAQLQEHDDSLSNPSATTEQALLQRQLNGMVQELHAQHERTNQTVDKMIARVEAEDAERKAAAKNGTPLSELTPRYDLWMGPTEEYHLRVAGKHPRQLDLAGRAEQVEADRQWALEHLDSFIETHNINVDMYGGRTRFMQMLEVEDEEFWESYAAVGVGEEELGPRRQIDFTALRRWCETQPKLVAMPEGNEEQRQAKQQALRDNTELLAQALDIQSVALLSWKQEFDQMGGEDVTALRLAGLIDDSSPPLEVEYAVKYLRTQESRLQKMLEGKPAYDQSDAVPWYERDDLSEAEEGGNSNLAPAMWERGTPSAEYMKGRGKRTMAAFRQQRKEAEEIIFLLNQYREEQEDPEAQIEPSDQLRDRIMDVFFRVAPEEELKKIAFLNQGKKRSTLVVPPATERAVIRDPQLGLLALRPDEFKILRAESQIDRAVAPRLPALSVQQFLHDDRTPDWQKVLHLQRLEAVRHYFMQREHTKARDRLRKWVDLDEYPLQERLTGLEEDKEWKGDILEACRRAMKKSRWQWGYRTDFLEGALQILNEDLADVEEEESDDEMMKEGPTTLKLA